MHLPKAFKTKLSEHKYAINAAMLGDQSSLPWSNLGYWQAGQHDYVLACAQLADHLAQAVNLNSKDKLLDLGCGQGASLLFWQQHYQVQYLAGVELQAQHVARIREQIPDLNAIYHASFLKLKEIQFSQKFDVVMCIDAAYHSPLITLLDNINSVLNSKARIGFHTLIWSDQGQHLNSLQKLQYRMLLKSADVHFNELKTASQLKNILEQFEFKDIEIEDLSAQVLSGFAHYVKQDLNSKGRLKEKTSTKLDEFKIQMTAKLCEKLFRDGFVKYVQVTAQSIK
ncbi:methyltransferase [Acinetobacter sp. NCu2D-2]|uniref:SAM-dependent methyltransferase n=1 Tax=Acinetobacter sp. NCu2D-2 TaxID=1608473 RepID=UPI0007CDCA90|nr:class I SAM-dependent methyltransferase [Acinetobacter sp. NCu2D-2]ANF80805.1 methyltransferase [Acinetobacter sp. NCu2D-2]